MASVIGARCSARGQLALVLLAHACLLAPQLLSFDDGSHPDEELYVAVSTELSSPLTPTLEGQAVFFKPPLLYWLQAASMRVLGAHLWAARLPSYLATLATALVLYLLLRRSMRVPHRLALLAASFLLSSFGFLRFGDLGMMDPAFSLALLGSFATAWSSARRPAWLLASAALVAAAILLKGPIGALLGGGFCALALLFRRRRPRVQMLALSLAILAALALPWFVIEWRAFGDEFLEKFLLTEHLQKLQGRRTLSGELFVLVMPLIAALPWVPLGRPLRRGPARVFAALVGFVVLAYALQSSRQLHYALPAIPFVVSLAALSRRSVLLAKSLGLVPVLLVAVAIVAGASSLGVLAAVASVLLAGVAFSLVRARPLRASLLLALLWCFVFGLWAPRALPPSFPASLAQAAGSEPVWLAGEDVGVARLETGVRLHRSHGSIAEAKPGELWLHRLAEHPDGEHLAQWPRLKLRLEADELWGAVRAGSVTPLTEPWALTRIH